MIKYSVLILLAVTVFLLALTPHGPDPFSLLRDPVPGSQRVAHSSHCAGCHGRDKSGQSLVDNNGNDVSIHDDWQVSMMGLSAHDPFWRATLAHEVNAYPTSKEHIESTCLKCHAPLGSIESHFNGLPYSFDAMFHDSLGLDGVSCSSCHQQPAEGLGSSHSGNFLIDTNRLIYGPYPNPVAGPMQIYVGFDPVFSDHIYSSGVCAGCHTLITETLDETGTATGEFFVEQATYHEWLNSIYPSQGKECQSCHMPFIEDSVIIATDLLALKKRYPYGLHQFFGANTAMLTMMHANKNELNLPPAYESTWSESIENNRQSLRSAADIAIQNMYVENDTLYVDVQIKNKTGHKLPTGYPSRIAWLQVELYDEQSQSAIYLNGLIDTNGNIQGRDLPYEPHHEIARSSGDVQIYEMVMSDLSGHLTTRLNGASDMFKDNRLLPLGFKSNHSTYDTVSVRGNAINDSNYSLESNKGLDVIQYRISLEGNKGTARLNISLKYHTFPSRWMQDLFANDSIPEVAAFRSMYAGYEDFTELIDEIEINNFSLSPSSISNNMKNKEINMYPNPGYSHSVFFNLNPDQAGLTYTLVNTEGKIFQHGNLSHVVNVGNNLPPGVYYFLIFKQSKLISTLPYTRI